MSKKKSITKVVRKINSNLPVKQKLNGLPLNPIARASGFIIRKKKITTKSLLGGFMLLCHLGKFSFEQWAIQISHLIKETVSRQAVWEKLTVQHRKFIKGVLESVIIKNFKRRYNTHISGLWNAFNRVFVQDSTCLKVPDHLWKSFTGGHQKG